MNIKFCTLFSGSSGNCEYLRMGDDEILIDAGSCTKTILSKLNEVGSSIERIKAVFITHDHIDHTKALKVLLRKTDADVYAPLDCRYGMDGFDGRIKFLPLPFEIRVGDMTVKTVATSHDSCGYTGYLAESGGVYIGVATDTGTVTSDMARMLGGCRYALVESNYDEEMLENGFYEPSLKKRIASSHGHLSNSDGTKFAAALIMAGARCVSLGHLSDNNNTPEKVRECMEKAIKEYDLQPRYTISSRYDVTVIGEEE